MQNQTAAKPRVGIIGSGAMGSAMARNLRARHYAVTVRGIRPEAHAQALQWGLAVSTSPAELAAAVDVIAIVVVNAAQIAEALALGIGLGLEPQAIFDIVSASSGNAWIFQDHMGRADQDDFAPRAATVQAPTALGAVAHWLMPPF